MIKLKLISLLALALMLGACADDNKKQKPTTETETTEPTTPPATAPFKLEVIKLKEAFGADIARNETKLGLVDKNNALIKQVEFKNNRFVFGVTDIGNYKICLLNSENKCEHYLAKNKTSTENISEAKIFNSENLSIEFTLNKNLSAKIKISNASYSQNQMAQIAYSSLLSCTKGSIPPSFLINSNEIVFYPSFKNAECYFYFGLKGGKNYTYNGNNVLKEFSGELPKYAKIKFDTTTREFIFKLP